jgi:phenylalanyl-tRNA synthetase beta chain
LLTGLLDAVDTNFRHQRRDVKLFEIGKVFSASPKENDLPEETELLALAVTGGEVLENKGVPARELDFFDAKGSLEAAVNSLNLPALEFISKDVKHLRKGQSAEVLLNGKVVGTIGKLNDVIAAGYKFKQPVFVAEVDLQSLLKAKQKEILYKPLPVFPSIVRDVSLLVKRSTSFAEIRQAIKNQGFELLRKIQFVDVYEGKGVAKDERSITIRLSYRASERTLIDEEVDTVHRQILGALKTISGERQRA